MAVEEHETYVVGCDKWGFSVSAHNSNACVRPGPNGTWEVVNAKGEVLHTAANQAEAVVHANRLNASARNQTLPDPHNNKPSLQRELWARDEVARPKYEVNPKHGATSRGTAMGVSSPAPTNGQAALDASVQVKGTSPRRVGIDPTTKEIVVFDEHTPDDFTAMFALGPNSILTCRGH